ncbi:hypothetical protein RBB50_007750 [Rhinocladiella similis]
MNDATTASRVKHAAAAPLTPRVLDTIEYKSCLEAPRRRDAAVHQAGTKSLDLKAGVGTTRWTNSTITETYQSTAKDHMAQQQVLFGMNMGWQLDRWTPSDDRVRGGKSQSYLESSGDNSVCFHGHLDIKALGGAGFASQRTAGGDRRWDLSAFTGIELSIDPSKSDTNTYTLILKDHLLPPNPENGREQSTVSWEYDFSKSNRRVNPEHNSSSATVFIPWEQFRPTYRGKPCSETSRLNLGDIRRISIMIRSFFGSQEGQFNLHINSLVASDWQTSTDLPT